VRERTAAAAETPLAVCENEKDMQAMLALLRNTDEPVKVRLAALQSLQAASFSVLAFEACRGDYIATLRKIADDPDPELRQRVLGLLAREKDGYAQKKLLEGLHDPAKALLPPEKALQLLSYDVHADAYAAARAIVKKPPNEMARREALRLLAADATAAPMFEKLMRDKNELREIRQISASALSALKPERLQKSAREILLDKSDYDDIKATSLTALTQLGDEQALAKDKALLTSVNRFRSGKTSAKYKQTARRFLDKYDRQE
jgi:HEAT repeat protein